MHFCFYFCIHFAFMKNAEMKVQLFKKYKTRPNRCENLTQCLSSWVQNNDTTNPIWRTDTILKILFRLGLYHYSATLSD